MEEKTITIPLKMFMEMNEAVSKYKAIAAVVATDTYGTAGKQIAAILEIAQKELE